MKVGLSGVQPDMEPWEIDLDSYSEDDDGLMRQLTGIGKSNRKFSEKNEEI